jgi:hypothetical protein
MQGIVSHARGELPETAVRLRRISRTASKTLSSHNAYERAQKTHADISCGHASRFTLSDSIRAWAADPMIWKGPK